MKIQHYLNRIDITQREKTDLFFLQKLMHQHFATVPFENIYVRQHKKIILQPESLYKKIVTQQRGGFCYELNGLFHWFLKSLGFSASIISAQVYNPSNNTFSPEFDHMALLVYLDTPYLVDVGFGDSLRRPISLANGAAQDISGHYQISQPQADNNIYHLQQLNENKWGTLYRFSDTQRNLSDFNAMCRFNATSEESHFTRKTVCTLATNEGRVTLSDEFLTITANGIKTKKEVSSDDNFKELLAKHFDLTF